MDASPKNASSKLSPAITLGPAEFTEIQTIELEIHRNSLEIHICFG